MDPVDDIKAGMVTLLETIPELAGKVFPEMNDDYYATYPAVSINIGGEDMRRTTRHHTQNELVVDDSDPDNIVTGREIANCEYPVQLRIRAVDGPQKRSLAAKILEKVLTTSMDTSPGAEPTGFYRLPSGAPSRIWFTGSEDWEDGDGEDKEGKKWKKIWVRDITLTVNAVLVVENPQTSYIVDEVQVGLFVNHDGLTDNNGETITII